jgi:signal transduction histidine kinase
MGDGTAHSSRGPSVKEIHAGAIIRRDEVEFYLRDTGMGFDPEDRETMFYVFRRGKNAAVRSIAGRGIGLSIVKSIVQTYNGAIWAEPVEGGGSIFRFTINAKYLVQSSGLAGAA